MLGEGEGLADRHGVVPAARFVVVLDPDAEHHRARVGRSVREALAGQDRGAQVGAREVRETGDGGAGHLADGLAEVEGGADAGADLVEELQPLADGGVLQVQLGSGRDQGGRRPLPRRDGLDARTAGHTPVRRHGHPVVLAELQDRVAQFEDLGDDAAAQPRPHVGQDLGQPPLQLVEGGQFGVAGEAGRDAFGGLVVVAPLLAEPGGVRGEHQQPEGAGPDQRVGPPEHVEPLTVGRLLVRDETGAARRGVRGPAAERGLQVGAERVVRLVGVRHRLAVQVVGEGAGDRQQVGRGAPDRFLPAHTEQPPRTAAPVGDEAVAVDDDHGQRNPAGRRVAGVAPGSCVPLAATVHGPGPLSPRLFANDLCRPPLR